MMIVFDGTRCRGFIIRCGREGFEAIDADDRSLGKFPTAIEAAAAVERAAAPDCARCGE
jgi:hypothetical protein